MIPNLIVPVLNRYDLLQRMLDSIDYAVGHLLIIDNGATYVEQDQELHVPPIVQQTTYLPMPSNLGVPGSWNLGIKLFPLADRWFFASNDMWFHKGQLRKLHKAARKDQVTLCADFPNWQAFVIGEEVVEQVGLFDEMLYPAYFEDRDYERRCKQKGVTLNFADVRVGHDNSSTIKSDTTLRFKNSTTFKNNAQYFNMKERLGDYSQGGWTLHTRRQNDWTQ